MTRRRAPPGKKDATTTVYGQRDSLMRLATPIRGGIPHLGLGQPAAVLRSAEAFRSATAGGAGWFIGAVLTFTVFIYAVAEIMANRIPSQEEYVGSPPVVAILPWSLAGSLFPITALPSWLASIARILPTTHTLALLRYGVLGRGGAGLHDMWGMSNTTTDAALSLLVLAAWAVIVTAASIRVFKRSAVN